MKRDISPKSIKKWEEYLKSSGLAVHSHKLRLPSRFKQASPWVKGSPSPAYPVNMLSNITVHDGWTNPRALKIAKEIVDSKPSLTLRDLLEEMLSGEAGNEIEYPYIWWVYPNSNRVRSLYEDSRGMTYIKLNNLWQMVYSVHSMGALVGRQGADSHEAIPIGGFFILWENEAQASKYNN